MKHIFLALLLGVLTVGELEQMAAFHKRMLPSIREHIERNCTYAYGGDIEQCNRVYYAINTREDYHETGYDTDPVSGDDHR